MHCLTKIWYIVFRTNVTKSIWVILYKDSQIKVKFSIKISPYRKLRYVHSDFLLLLSVNNN